MITEEMLTIACADLNQALLDSLPEPEECIHTFSDRFLKKMKRLIWKDAHPAASWILQRAASIVLVLFLSFAVLLALSPAVRAHVVHWVRETFSFFTQYSYQGAESNQEDADYYLSYVPKPYIEFKRLEYKSRTEISYYNPDTNQILHFVYYRNQNTLSLNLDSRQYIISRIPELGSQADFYQSTDSSLSNAIAVYDSDRDTLFWISGDLSRDELIQIYKKIKISKK